MRTLLFVTCACLASACGDDAADESGGRAGTGGAASGVASGLPPEAVLSELDDAQLTTLCEAFVSAINVGLTGQLPVLQCSTSAVQASIGVSQSGQVTFDVGACEQRFDACLTARDDAGDAGPAVGAGLDCNLPATTAAQRTCAASVAQYERCFSAVIADFDTLVPRTGCYEALGVLDAGAIQTPAAPPMVPPPQCAALIELCPQVAVPPSRPQR